MVDGDSVVAAWQTNNRATTYLVEHLPDELWKSAVPGVPTKTVRGIAAHLHNIRCRWIKALGQGHGVAVPRRVDPRRVTQKQLVRALSRSSKGIVSLVELGVECGGRVPRATWQNFPTDLEHFLGYFAAHEAHHRGQIILIARQLGQRLPSEVVNGVWQWTKRSRE